MRLEAELVDEVAEEQTAARRELERRRADEASRYYRPNGRLRSFLELAKGLDPKSHDIYIFILRAGNNAGKTALAANIINYLCDRTSNPYFDQVPYFKDFIRPNRGRLCTTRNAAKNTYEEEFAKWLPRGHYNAVRAGHEFQQHYRFKRTNSEFDIFTFDQDPIAGESLTLRWAVIDEPMQRRHFSGLKARFRFGGVIFILMTALEHSGWVHDELELESRLGRDVFVMECSSEDNCIEHGIDGVIPHAALEAQWRDFDPIELPARKDGKYLHLSGVIYSTYRIGYETEGRIVGHEPPALYGYYAECWRRKDYTLCNIIDPHDRKPFAVGWYATFPNEDTWTVAEWPDAAMPMFHRLRSWSWGPLAYAKMIKATEEHLGKSADVRLIDPNFGNAPKATTKSTIKHEMLAAGESIGWRLFYRDPPDDVPRGHLLVKDLLGDPAAGLKPKLYNMSHCRNHSYGAQHYGYHENKDETRGLSEAPELKNKDFMDLWRYGALYGFKYRQRLALAQDLWTPVVHGNGYVGV